MIPHSKPMLGKEETEALSGVIASGMLVGGPETTRFRTGIEAVAGLKPAALFSSGRAAISAALSALGLERGSGVIVQTYVCDAVVWAILQNGLQPVFCDVGDGWTATAETVAAARTSNCRAVILAPPFGFQQSAQDFRGFGLPIIHDLCQADPGGIAEARPGRLGDLVTLSFHPTKYMCAGGGGALLSTDRNADLAALEQAVAEASPFNDLQAAVGNVQLGRLEGFAARRSELATSYVAAAGRMAERLAGVRDVAWGSMFRLPFESDAGFDTLAESFRVAGVIARRGVDHLAHRSAGLTDDEFPNALARFAKTISLPFYPALSDAEAEMVINALRRLS